MKDKIAGLIFCTVVLVLGLQSEVLAQDHASEAAQANNPLANMTAFNLQNYYIGELTETDDSANQFWFRFAKPFAVAKTNWIMRASLPINTFPTPPDGDKETGIGDLNVFAAICLLSTGRRHLSSCRTDLGL